jgi:hypothetical protein
MSDLISRQNAVDAVLELSEKLKNEMLFIDAIVDEIENIPSAEPEQNIIRCADCKWWNQLEDGHPYGYCRACRSGEHSERWEISIRRQCKFDFYCADAEPIENEDDDE